MVPAPAKSVPQPPRAVSRAAGASRLACRIGGISFGISAAGGLPLVLEPALREFAIAENSCDVEVRVALADSLEFPRREPSFRSGGVWSLFEDPAGCRFSFSTPFLGCQPYKEAWFDPTFTRGQVLLNGRCFDPARPVYPLEYPLDELLMIHRLARGAGVEVHAAGIVDPRGRGHLFLGHSGAGKSTTARLWMSREGVRILSDDRIILRRRGDDIWMYGTPWHGDAGIASPEAAPLSEIFLLEHAAANEKLRVPPGRAAAELFARSFVPHYSAEALRFALQFLEQVARRIPCSVFRFIPDESAVEAVCRAQD